MNDVVDKSKFQKMKNAPKELEMTEDQLMMFEALNYKSSWTNNQFFDDNGYFVIKKLMNPEWVEEKPTYETGAYDYHGSMENFTYYPFEQQVPGSLSRYSYPNYKDTHAQIKLIVEEHIGRKLHPTYYFDRFYYKSTSLNRHIDRPACEISVTYHVGSNMKKEWPIWIKGPNTYDENGNFVKHGENHSVVLEPGDAMVYKGSECRHWRDALPNELFNKNQYHHQIFYHYVLQDGCRSHYAFDKCKWI